MTRQNLNRLVVDIKVVPEAFIACSEGELFGVVYEEKFVTMKLGELFPDPISLQNMIAQNVNPNLQQTVV
jgi:hypothetical protein